MSSSVAQNGGLPGKPSQLTARQNAQLRRNYKRALSAAELKESELALRLGVARHTLTDLGRSPAGPRLATLLAIARELGLYSIDELLGPSGTESMQTAGSEP
jgi:DNA-binding XRE family transcriptional regulator